MLAFNWKFLTPLALVLLVVTAVVEKLVETQAVWARVGSHLVVNLVLIWVTIQILRVVSRRAQADMLVFETRPVAMAPEPVAEPSAEATT
jgi:hypothetical protein